MLEGLLRRGAGTRRTPWPPRRRDRRRSRARRPRPVGRRPSRRRWGADPPTRPPCGPIRPAVRTSRRRSRPPAGRCCRARRRWPWGSPARSRPADRRGPPRPGPGGAGPAAPPPPPPARHRPGCGSGSTRWARASGPAAPPSARSETPSTANPAAEPISRSRATLPLRPWPKWKSSPTTTSRASSPSTSIDLDEVLRRLVGPLLVEGDDHRPVHPGRLEQLELLVEVAEELGRRLRAHHGGRVAVEGDHGGGRARPPAPGPGARRAGPGGRGGHRRRRRWSPRSPGRGRAGRQVGHDLHHRGRLLP